MYGERDEPQAVLPRLGRRLEESLAPEATLPTIVETVAEALKLPYAAIALDHRARADLAAVYERQPDGRAGTGPPAADLVRLPLVYQGATVGTLLLAPRAPGEGFGAADRRLLEQIARQAGIAAHAVRLTADLQRSRERLVAAREEERRRLRRDLHDGLGPRLASLSLQLAAARNRLGHDPIADGLLTNLKAQTQEAVADVRRVVYALRLPALDELGLVGAIREHAARWGDAPRVTVAAPDPLPPLPAAVEVAAYRIALEALTNVARHAGARECHVRLAFAGEVLELEIADDGRGITPDARRGAGLQSMRERVEELGGKCAIEPLPGGGTRVTARLPLGESAVAESQASRGG
ncbi:MAG: sensor histidine kinase [Chloroflexota bacterium]|nr:sensor histidine kinase [Chloroflexota bacterium]